MLPRSAWAIENNVWIVPTRNQSLKTGAYISMKIDRVKSSRTTRINKEDHFDTTRTFKRSPEARTTTLPESLDEYDGLKQVNSHVQSEHSGMKSAFEVVQNFPDFLVTAIPSCRRDLSELRASMWFERRELMPGDFRVTV